MAVALKNADHNRPQAKSESQRLKELKEEASRIRQKHEAGLLTSKEAASELAGLKRRYRSLLDALF